MVGALPDIVEDQFRRLFAEIGIPRVDFFPPRRSHDICAIGPGTRFLLAQPFLGDTSQKLVARGARRLPALFPFGAEGTTAWLKAAADAWGIADDRFNQAIAPGRDRARRALDRFRMAVGSHLCGGVYAFRLVRRGGAGGGRDRVRGRAADPLPVA